MWKGQGSFECAGFNAGAVGIADRIYILGGDYSPDEITDEVQVRTENSKPVSREYVHCCVSVDDYWGGFCSCFSSDGSINTCF